MAIDYEAEYNNRARVPEHPAIIDGWARDAAAYRETHPPTVIAYGSSERQRIDLFEPRPRASGALAVFIHGGYWQALDRHFFSHMARGLNAHGIAVAVPGYELCPRVRVGNIIEGLRAACRTLAPRGQELVVAGHSAGGHLAACMLATDWDRAETVGRPVVRAAYAISGLFDLRPLIATSVNGALGLDDEEAAAASPLFWAAPAGLSLDAVVGANESAEYLRQSRTIIEAWAAKGVRTRYEAIPGANHFTVIAALADPASAMTRRLAELAGATRSRAGSPSATGVA